MSSDTTDIILLAPEADLCREVSEALPQAAAYDSPLEALADFAAGSATALVATTGGLGYRGKEIIAAARRAKAGAPVFVLGPPEEESPMAELVEAGANDYFLWPFGLHELTLAVTAHQRPQIIPMPRAESRPPGLRLHAAKPQEPPLTPAIRRIMRTLCRLAGRPSRQIASRGAESLLEMDELAGVSLFDLANPKTPLAWAGAPPETATIAKALLQRSLPVDRWTPLAGGTWLLVDSAEEGGMRWGGGSRLAVAASVVEGPVSAALLDELMSCANVLMALASAARQKEAALRVLSTDGETGLASRRYLDHYLTGLLRRAGQKRCEVTLALFWPVGEPSLVGATLRPLAEMMTEHLGGSDTKLARADDSVLAAVGRVGAVRPDNSGRPVVRVGEADGSPTLRAARRIETFARLVAEASLPARVAVAMVAFPWHGSSAAELMQAARQGLAESRRRNFLPIMK